MAVKTDTRTFLTIWGWSVRKARWDPGRWTAEQDEYIDFRPGARFAAADVPPHTDLAGLLASGHIEEVT